MVFYEYFFKSCVGDAEWKAACVDTSSTPSAPVANFQTEAFALLVLRNNYFAWLLDIKKKSGSTLVTDYDDVAVVNTRNDIGEAFLKMEVDLVGNPSSDNNDDDNDEDFDDPLEEEEEEQQVDCPQEEEEGAATLLVPPTSRRYRRLRRQTAARMEAVRIRARQNPKYKDLLKTLAEYHTLQTSGTLTNANDQRTNRRKMLRQFRVYTNGRDDQERFKGWSQRAKGDLKDLTKHCRDLVHLPQTKRFREAYRQTFADKRQSAKKPVKTPSTHEPIEHEDDIWGIGDDVLDVTSEIYPV